VSAAPGHASVSGGSAPPITSLALLGASPMGGSSRKGLKTTAGSVPDIGSGGQAGQQLVTASSATVANATGGQAGTPPTAAQTDTSPEGGSGQKGLPAAGGSASTKQAAENTTGNQGVPPKGEVHPATYTSDVVKSTTTSSGTSKAA
jgi:hypothetical protein